MPTAVRTLALVLVLAFTPAARGQSYLWNNPSGGSFQESNNWFPLNGLPGSLPGAGAAVFFVDANSAYSVSFASSVTNGAFTQSAGNVTLDLGSNTYTVAYSGGFTLGNTSGVNTTLTLSGGTLALSGNNSGFATATNSVSTLVVGGTSSATVTAAGSFDIGVSGTSAVVIMNNSSFSDWGGSYIGDNAGSAGTLLVRSGNYSSLGNFILGRNGSGTLQVGSQLEPVNTTATATITNGFTVGNSAGATGFLQVENGGILNTRGTITFGASAASGPLAGATGVGTVSSGTWNHTNAGTQNVLTTGNGTANLQVFMGGTLNVSGQTGSGINLVPGPGGILQALGGTINVSGAGNGITLKASNQLFISSGGTVNTVNLTAPGVSLSNFVSGTLNINGGTFNNGSSNSFNFGTTSGNSVALNLNGGATFSPTGFLGIGSGGHLTVQGGSNLTVLGTNFSDGVGGSGSTPNSSLTVTGANSQANLRTTNVGVFGSGTLNVSNGGTLSTGGQNLYVGAYNASSATTNTGVVNVSGGTVNLGAGNLILGFGTVNGSGFNGGVGNLTISNGGTLNAALGYIGNYLGSTATATVGGGGTGTSSLLTGGLTVGGGTSGVLNITSRGVVTTPNLNVNPTGVVNLTGGTLNLGSELTGTGTFNHAGGTLNYTDNVTVSRAVVINGGTMSLASGKTATFSNTTVTGGTYAGPGTFATTAGQATTLTNVTTAPSATLTLAGADNVINSNLGGITTVTASGSTPAFNRVTNTTSGRLTLNSTAQATVSDFVSNGLVTLTDGTSTAARTRMTNTGTADLYFGGGSRTFIGTPTGAANGRLATLDLGGRNAVVTGGLFVNNGTVSNGTVVADYGALVKGAGFFANAPVTQNGGAFQAGNSPGRVDVGSFDINGGGQLNFQINNATGASGPTPDVNNQVSGWGLVRSIIDETTGNLTVSATAGSKYTLKLQTLLNPSNIGQDNFGLMANFDNTQAYSWTFLTYEGSYTGPTDLNSVFNIDASQFQNALNGGTFSITHNTAAHTVNLTFSPVPEPATTLALAVAGLAGWSLWRRRTATR